MDSLRNLQTNVHLLNKNTIHTLCLLIWQNVKCSMFY